MEIIMQEQKTPYKGIYKAEEGVFINKDNQSLQAYKKQKKQMQEMAAYKQEVASLKTDIEEIKELLKGLVK
jgi:cell shape-determining protein MreC